MSLATVISCVSNATESGDSYGPGMNAIGGHDDCSHPREVLSLVSTNGMTYYYRCADCDAVVIVWRR
jgi:hypothetical protein